MNRIIITRLVASFLVLVSLAACFNNPKSENDTVSEENEEVVVLKYGFPEENYKQTAGVVKKNQFFSNLLNDLGLSNQEAYNLTIAVDSIFDVKKFKVGNKYKAYYTTSTSELTSDVNSSSTSVVTDDEVVDVADTQSDSTLLKYLVYDKDSYTEVLFECRPPYKVTEIKKPIEKIAKYADVTIETSLWNDMIKGGASPLLSLNLSDIYAWTIDFFGLQKGDRFRVFYEELACDGKIIEVDTVFYAVFYHGGQEHPAIMFNQHDSGNVYWNEKGESMRKAFLKAPLKFSRISSGFTYARRHPITRKVQPHTGIDYAAPLGTPVMTIGDGVVTSRRNEGAGGNTIRIKHNSVYSSAYLHLSKYAKNLKVGQRVAQGEVIGYVGSTGRSTGPHLDFRIWKNGTPINPLKLESPPALPLEPENQEAFKTLTEKYQAKLDSLDRLLK